jgi:hypothetical protein
MKKAESKNRVFHFGITAAVFIALAGLGACVPALVSVAPPPPEPWTLMGMWRYGLPFLPPPPKTPDRWRMTM